MPLYSALTENKETPNQRMFDACRIICSRPGTFERVRPTVDDETHHTRALIQMEGILNNCLNCDLIKNVTSTVTGWGTCTVNVLLQM
jgi:hypothetical protein